MTHGAIAERYARAIFDLGLETGQLTQISEQIRRVAELYQSSPELRAALDNPVVAESKRDALVKDIAARLSLSQPAASAIRLLAVRRRLKALPEIARQLGKLADEKAGILRATVVSAQPLPESYYRELQAELEKATSRKIVLEKEQDPSLIAGVVARIGDNTVDGSIKGRLAALERELTVTA